MLWKVDFIIMNLMLLLSVLGGRDGATSKAQDVSSKREEISLQDDGAEPIIEICYDLYEKAAEEDKFADLEMIRSIVKRFGENGYASVDSKNQIDMVCAEQVMNLCQKVEAKEESEVTVIEVNDRGGFVIYDLQTKDGKVDVVRTHFTYEDGKLQKVVTGSYPVENWNYTEDGYLMFSGIWYSEELYVLTLSGAYEYTAFRVQPLDEKCRELNRKYLLPVSYECNNMFLVDWNEEDFGELDFYDMYDVFYRKLSGRFVPYAADDNLNVGAVYQIPAEEFEGVIQNYIQIDSSTLRSKTIYDSENATYEYKPRGFYEAEYPEYPYSEVIDYTENSDGTITLMAHVVFPYAGISKVYAHEVVVRPLGNDGVHYVSNRVIFSEDDYERTWYTPRLTKEEWEEIYGGE